MTLSAATVQKKASCMRVRTFTTDASCGSADPFWSIDEALRVVGDAPCDNADPFGGIAEALRAIDDAFGDIDGTSGMIVCGDSTSRSEYYDTCET